MPGHRRVLIVEDDGDIRSLSGVLLQEEGFEVFTAGDGPHALRLVRSMDAPPDMVLIELHLPGMDGVEFAAALRKVPGCNNVPVILISGEEDLELRARCVPSASALARPFGMGDLLWMIRTLVLGPHTR